MKRNLDLHFSSKRVKCKCFEILKIILYRYSSSIGEKWIVRDSLVIALNYIYKLSRLKTKM